jgi:hypothetical protein
MANPGKLIEVTEVNGIGTRHMSFRTQMTKDQFFEAMNEQGRVFKLEMRSWDAETGEAEITLVPGNGLMAWYEGHNPPIEDESPTLPPEDPNLARSNLGCFIKTYFPKAEFGMDIAAFAARIRADRNNHFLDSTSLAESVLKKDPSPTLPPEGPQLG